MTRPRTKWLFHRIRVTLVACVGFALYPNEIVAQDHFLSSGPSISPLQDNCESQGDCPARRTGRSIIMLKGPSVAEVMSAEQHASKGTSPQTWSASAIKAGETQVSALMRVHTTATQALRQKNIRVLHSYRTTINALAVDKPLSLSQARQLLPGQVLRVVEDRRVQALLDKSVPLTKAPEVWKLLDGRGVNLTGRGVRIGIIDTGIDYTHADLGGCARTANINKGSCAKVVGGYDFVNRDNDPFDDNGHGTHCAATAAGNGALLGMAPDATLYAYKVLSSKGYGSTSTLIAAIERSVDPNQDGNPSDHLDVISISIGGPDSLFSDAPDSIALDRAVSLGVIAVVAAGNEGPGRSTVATPGTSRRAITVGASDGSTSDPQSVASFSSQGPIQLQREGKRFMLSKPDIIAPGHLICAAKSSHIDGTDKPRLCHDSTHVLKSGTSMATPHVAGLAALLRQAHSDWTPDEIKSAITSSASQKLKDSYDDVYAAGSGAVDAVAAVLAPRGLAVIGDFEVATSAPKVTLQVPKGWTYTFSATPESPLLELEKAPWVTLLSAVAPSNMFTTTLNLSSLPQGKYTGRLRVVSPTGETLTDYASFDMTRFEIVAPREGDVVNMRDPLRIQLRRFQTSPFESLMIDFAVNDGPWQTDGVTSSLATFTASIKLPQSTSTYLLKVRVRLKTNGYEDSLVSDLIRVDPRLLPGFPIRIYQDCGTSPESGCHINQRLHPVLSDLDGDNRKELLVWLNTASYDPDRIAIYNDRGERVRSFPIMSHPLESSSFNRYPVWPLVVTDLDGDQTPEIVVIQSRNLSWRGSQVWSPDVHTIAAYDAHGNLKRGFPVLLEGLNENFLVADLNRDGRKEIVVQSKSHSGIEPRQITVISDDGTITGAATLPHATGRIAVGLPHEGGNMVVGNFDGEPELEVAAFDQTQSSALSNTTTQVFTVNWNQFGAAPAVTEQLSGALWGSAAVMDDDTDGMHEILLPLDDTIAQTSKVQHISFLPQGVSVSEISRSYGTGPWCMNEWPNLCGPYETGFIRGHLKGSEPSILGFARGGTFMQMHRFGHGEALGTSGVPFDQRSPNSPPVIADVTGDGENDIIFASNRHYFVEPQNWGITIQTSESNYSNFLTLATEGNAYDSGFVTTTITDINNDNSLDIVAGSLSDSAPLPPYYQPSKGRFSIYAFSTSGSTSANKGTWTSFLGNSDRNACLDCSGPTIPFNDPAPHITQHPRSAEVKGAGAVSISVKAQGSNLRYQWEKEGYPGSGWYPIKGATSSSLNVNAEGNASQSFRVRVSSLTRSVMSNPATIAPTGGSNNFCPPGSVKETPGVCGCNERDVDADRDRTLDCLERKKYKTIPRPTVEQSRGAKNVTIQLPALAGASRYTLTLRRTSRGSASNRTVTKSGTGRTFTLTRMQAGTYTGNWTATIAGVPGLSKVSRSIGPIVVK